MKKSEAELGMPVIIEGSLRHNPYYHGIVIDLLPNDPDAIKVVFGDGISIGVNIVFVCKYI